MNKKIVVTSNVLPVGEFYTYHENESRDILFIFRRELQKVAKELEDDFNERLNNGDSYGKNIELL